MNTLPILAVQLALRLAARCPACRALGWGRIHVSRGLPCEFCSMPTHMIAAEIFGCAACDQRE